MIVIVVRCNGCRRQFPVEYSQTAGGERIRREVERQGWKTWRVSSLVHYCPKCAAGLDESTRPAVHSGGAE